MVLNSRGWKVCGQLFALSSLLSCWGGHTALAYYGRHSTEARLEYRGYVDSVGGWSRELSQADLNGEGSIHRRAMEVVDAQVQHLMGSFQSQYFLGRFPFQGVLGQNYDIRFLRPERLERGWRLHYAMRGRVVFDKRAFQRQAERSLPVILPRDPQAVYAFGVRNGHNRCTDEHYNTEGDFWYFWDPALPGCPLLDLPGEVAEFSGRLVEVPNTESTYPEYDRLFGSNGNGDRLQVSVFLGYIDDLPNLRVPRRRDQGYAAMQEVESHLRELGFELSSRHDAFRVRSDGRMMAGINFLRTYTKSVEVKNLEGVNTMTVEVQVLLADTAMASRDETFHHYLVPALRASDLLVYDGHSGLGGNLDLSQIRGERFDPNKYQLFFINGCSSYPYFGRMFQEAKGGTKNMDVIVSGLPTLTDTAGPNVIAFLRPFLEGKLLSFQKVLASLERSNGENGTYLTGVVGDEDNRYSPARR